MRIVISYAREDRAVVSELVEILRALGHDAWTDAGAHAGARWWEEIVERIRACDVLLAVTSPASLVSRACTLERQYALMLNRRLLPVAVAAVDMHSLPSDFAQIHFFDFTVRNATATGRLHQALAQIPPAPALPRPLPPAPPPPLSYLNSISDQIAALPQDLDAQHRIVTALLNGIRSEDSQERETAGDLMRRYLNHPHRLPDPAERASRGVSAQRPAPGPSPYPVQAATSRPPVKRSKAVTVLAWLGGLFVVLILLGVWAATAQGGSDPPPDPTSGPSSGTGTGTSTNGFVEASVVAQAVYDNLVAKGYPMGTVSCNSLEAVVGASTVCNTPGFETSTTLITVTQVRGGTVTDWNYN